MSIYNNSAFGPPYKQVKRLGTQTEPNYLFGDFDFKTQPWSFGITQVALSANVATVTGTLKGGGGASLNVAPMAGAKMGVRGTASNSGIFNADPATVTAVSWNAATGIVSVSYALSHGNVSTTADTGELVILPLETADPVGAGTASQPIALIFSPDESDNSRCLFAEAKWTGTQPSAAVVVLQVANVDDDARYMTVTNAQGCAPGGSVTASQNMATIAGSVVTQSGAQYSFIMGKFVRAKVLSMTGGDGTTGLIVTVFG